MRLLMIAVLVIALAGCDGGGLPFAGQRAAEEQRSRGAEEQGSSEASAGAISSAPPLLRSSAPSPAPAATPPAAQSTPDLPAMIAAAVAATQTAAATTTAPATVPSPRPTRTPAPATPTPVPAMPRPTFQPVRQTLGAIPGGARGEQYAVEVTLTDVWYWPGDRYTQPAPGHAFLIVDVELRNLGPASIRGLTSFDFQVIDANRAVQHHRLLRATQDCPLELVELLPGGWTRACFGYQVLAQGPLEFIVAPSALRAGGLTTGRYLSFPLRAA